MGTIYEQTIFLEKTLGKEMIGYALIEDGMVTLTHVDAFHKIAQRLRIKNLELRLENLVFSHGDPPDTWSYRLVKDKTEFLKKHGANYLIC